MIDLRAVAYEDARLQRLLQLYLHEWSGIFPARVPIGVDACFRYEKTENLDGALFVSEGLPVGFALVAEHHVEEFFVIAGARRRGVGLAAARALFASRPGPWTLTVRPENPGALAFWRRAMPGATEKTEVGADGVARTRLTS